MNLKKVSVDISKYENIYIMSDIHGYYKEFKDMLYLIKFSLNDLLIINGDVIDRGYDSLKVLNYCFSKKNIILLMGNHEYMMTSLITYDISMFNRWMLNGGDNTNNEFQKIVKSDYKYSKYLLAMVCNLPHYIELEINNENYLILHAGISATMVSTVIDKIMAIQGEKFLWIRDSFLKCKYKTPFTVIFGHTPTYIIDYEINNNYPSYYFKSKYDKTKVMKDASKSKIWYGVKKIGIDCGLFSGGKLACLRLNDMNEFYVNKL